MSSASPDRGRSAPRPYWERPSMTRCWPPSMPKEPSRERCPPWLIRVSRRWKGSRLWAGANYPSDAEAGLALGQEVGQRAVARGKADSSDAKWDGSGRLTGEGTWEPTPPKFVETPVEPLGGTWETWVLPSGDAVRPAPPPEYGSPLWQAE